MFGKLTWFVLYTKPRFEQKVYYNLLQMGINSYLPMQKTLKQWSDRKKWVHEPLFKSYCFVQIKPEYYREPLKANGVLRYIWFEGKPVPVSDKEIETIKLLCDSNIPVEVVELTLIKGQTVKIINGVLKGLVGEYLKKTGQHKILVRIDSINQGLMVSVPPAYVVACRI
ncbi:MAG: antitermination protein NusG [Bacteroidetes bacterium CG23_combo_of_CG06-09_8_20_14_all_32_9]|nr:MAG: antitermination protein NusG [Bacteroidetes bacterium CG23_combo_of_CG06-09_8_20_14_all_32_9]